MFCALMFRDMVSACFAEEVSVRNSEVLAQQDASSGATRGVCRMMQITRWDCCS
jgi:hypothetical protein